MNEGGKIGKRSYKKLITGCAIIFASVAIAAAYFGWQFFSQKKSPDKAKQETAARIIEDVSRIYALPTNEKPTVAQVQNKTKLVGQAFFDKAQNNDYVIVYEKTKLALLYRDHDKKLINVGPVSIDSDQQTQTITQSSTQPKDN